MPLPKNFDFQSLPVALIDESYIANRYVRQKILGSGTFGNVFLVKDVRQPVAVKRAAKEIQLPDGEEDIWADAVKEAQLLSNLYHPHIVQLCDAFCENKAFYIVMEYCQHGTLEEYIQKRFQVKHYLCEDQVICWLSQLADALSYIHSKRIIHRDLKSRNIFLHQNPHGNWQDLKIGDFGISRTLYTSTEKATTMIGTPFYLSPELLQHLPYDRKSDSWALGCLLYEMCALTYPFNTTESLSDLMKLIVYSEPSFEKFPDNLKKLQILCRNLLEKVPMKRPSAENILIDTLVSKHIENHISHHDFCRSMMSFRTEIETYQSTSTEPKSGSTKIEEEEEENVVSWDEDSSTLNDTIIAL